MVWFLEYYWVSFFVLLAIVGYGKYNTSVRYTKSTLDDANARKPASAEFINDATLYAKKKGCEAQFHQLLKRINKDFDCSGTVILATH